MRLKLLVYPKFQVTIIAWMIGIAISTITLFYISNIILFNYYLQQGKTAGLPKDHVFFQFLRDQYTHMRWIFLGTSFLAFTLICLAGLILSNRVAGPLCRFRKHLDAIAEGKVKLSGIKFRTHDYFTELADSFNKAIETIEKKDS